VPFNWRGLARISILAAVICIVIAVVTLFADKQFVEFVKRIFTAPDLALCLALSVVAAVLYWGGIVRHRRHPEKIFTNEAIYLLAVVATAGGIFFFGKVIDNGSGHFSVLILLACFVYAGVALYARSKLIWIFSLLSLGGWLGAETGYVSGWGAYYFGMNYPLRFVFFGAALCFASYALTKSDKLDYLFKSTYVIGLLYLFMALWLMSIFGNYGDGESWRAAKQIELFHWSILFAAVAAAVIWHGLKFDNAISRGFGITFLFINLYTRFFEYFWDPLHKAIFFAVLGVSLWYLGSKAQRIWNLGRSRELENEMVS